MDVTYVKSECRSFNLVSSYVSKLECHFDMTFLRRYEKGVTVALGEIDLARVTCPDCTEGVVYQCTRLLGCIPPANGGGGPPHNRWTTRPPGPE